MHQSGHSRAQSMQTVQFSSSSAITPRERGGRSGSTSGYCWVVDRLVIVLRVTASPFARPSPGMLMASHPALCACRTRPPPVSRPDLAECDLDAGGEHQLAEGHRHQHQPAEPLELVLAQPRVGHPQPDDHEGDREDLQQRPQPAELVVGRTGPASRRGTARWSARRSPRCRRTRRAGRTRTAGRCTRSCSRRPAPSRRSACRTAAGGSRPARRRRRSPCAGACQSSHHGCHASTMPGRLSVPAAIATLAAASTSGSS